MPLTSRQSALLLVSVFIIAICSLIYQLIIGTLSSYLFGNSVAHFSLTIGLFMSAMGIGSFASRWVTRSVLGWFIALEMAIGLLGGTAAALLYTVFATTRWYHVAMVTLIIIIGSLIGMEIPLLTRISGGRSGIKDALANVLAFDYAGALIASIAFPLILLPELGILQTSFVTGLLNMGVVFVNLRLFWSRLVHGGQLLVASVAVTLLLMGGSFWSNQITSFFERQLYDDEIIYTQQTSYQRIVMTRWGADVRLFLDGNLQFSTRDEYRYHEPLVHPAMSLSRSREEVLVLGGGDGLAVREILKYDEVRRVVLVDIDPAMTELARQHPTIRAANEGALDDPRVELVHQDAYTYLAENADRFGVIIVDLPDPNNEALGKLYSREFYILTRRHLGVGGVMAVQATSPYFARQSYWCIVHTLADAGLQVVPYHTYVPSFGDWGYVLAAEHELAPERFAMTVPGRFLTAEIFAASQLFDADSSEIPTEVNRLDRQVILPYYERDWKQWD
jgi:spermidine synthase